MQVLIQSRLVFPSSSEIRNMPAVMSAVPMMAWTLKCPPATESKRPDTTAPIMIPRIMWERMVPLPVAEAPCTPWSNRGRNSRLPYNPKPRSRETMAEMAMTGSPFIDNGKTGDRDLVSIKDKGPRHRRPERQQADNLR